MAKKGKRHHIVLRNPETGQTYHSTKNKQNTPDRIRIKKYDKALRKHVEFVEEK